MSVISIPDGTVGFDANTTLTPVTATKFFDHGYRFAIRYLRRTTHRSYDLTANEASIIAASGLGLMAVQHVAPDPWVPSGNLGSRYGNAAVDDAETAGLPEGTTIWCDLEGVAAGVPAVYTVAYCNNWYDVLRAAGYIPGLYVGFNAGLTAKQLFRNLRFQHYWAAYNLNRDEEPLVRGVQMRQRAKKTEDVPPGVAFSFDVDYVQADALGGRPTMIAPL